MYLPRDTTAVADLAKRYGYGYGCNPYYSNCNSAWTRWGRWVLTGILILIGLFLFAVFYFCRARRRRRARTSTTPLNNYNQGYNNESYNQQYTAPPGPPPNYGNTGYDGYYGQQGGVTQPTNTYKP